MRQVIPLVPFVGIILALAFTSVVALTTMSQPTTLARLQDELVVSTIVNSTSRVQASLASLDNLTAASGQIIDRNRKALANLSSQLTLNLLGAVSSVAANADVGAAVVSGAGDNVSSNIWLGFKISWQKLLANLGEYRKIILANWHTFLYGRGESVAGAGATRSNRQMAVSGSSASVDREALKAEIQAELRAEFNQYLKNAGAGPNFSEAQFANSGLVVLPTSGSTSSDASLKAYIKNSFSDDVKVRFDEDKSTGVVTPVFRSGSGSDYLFILTPLQKQ